MNTKFQRFRRAIRNRFYREETGFLLNYLTLQIEDKAIASHLRAHRTQ
jgi:hypothetical protein